MRHLPIRALALTLVLALASACSGDGAPQAEQPAPATSPADPRPSAPQGGEDVSSERPGEGKDAGRPAGTGDPSDGGGETGEDPVLALPPAPGTYRYAQTGETRAGFFTISPDPEGTLRVQAATSAGRGRRQQQVRSYSDQQSQEQVFLFRGSTVLLESLSSYYAQQETECRLEQPVVVVRLPLEPGAHWTDRGTCEGLELKLTAEVLGTADVAVAGDAVPTTKIRYRIDVSGGGLEQTTRSTTWLSEAHRLIVRNVSRASGSINGTEYTEERTERLLSLTPA